MDILTLVQTLSRWAVPALIGGLVLLAAVVCTCLLFQKFFHKQRTLTWVQMVCLGLLCCWLVLVLCLTALSRGANFTGSVNVDFLSGYRSAWNNWSLSELQLILFNMLMFAPLGFLLPLVWRRAERFQVALLCSLGATCLIEVLQLLTGTGIFELDDLFHNLLGSLFGYFCIRAILTWVRAGRFCFAPLARALAIPCAVGLVLCGVFAAYALQPYGNLSIRPAAPQDLTGVQITAQWTPSDQSATASVYRNRYAGDKAYVCSVRDQLAQLENLHFQPLTRREDENRGYTGTNAQGDPCRLMFFFRTGEWSYTTFAQQAAQLAEPEISALRRRYETWMTRQGLLPDNAVFSVQNGDTLRWDADPDQDLSTGTGSFAQGSVLIQLDESGALSTFFYQITWNEYAATEPILSQQQAFEQVQQGAFQQYVPFQPGDEVCVTGCRQTYLYDSKGFYQPVYQFEGYLNDPENQWTCQIAAR